MLDYGFRAVRSSLQAAEQAHADGALAFALGNLFFPDRECDAAAEGPDDVRETPTTETLALGWGPGQGKPHATISPTTAVGRGGLDVVANSLTGTWPHARTGPAFCAAPNADVRGEVVENPHG